MLAMCCLLLVGFADGFRPYPSPEKDKVLKRLHYLETSIGQNDHEKNQYMGYEGQLFTLSYTALAINNIGAKWPELNKRLKLLAALLVKEINQSSLANAFYESSDEIDPTSSILYWAHWNFAWCIAAKLEVLDSTQMALHQKRNHQLLTAFERAQHGFIPSYPSAIWVTDNVAGLASMQLFHQVYGEEKPKLLDSLLQRIDQEYCDEALNLPNSTINPQTGESAEAPRGSMLGWSIIFSSYVNQQISKKWFENFKTHMGRNRLLFYLFKEWPKGADGQDDMDSGPTLWSYSIPANAFALGGALVHEDYCVANKCKRLMRWGRSSIETDSTLRYKTRAIDLNASPMMEALSLYLETMHWANSNQ